jgi:hypothetical protein
MNKTLDLGADRHWSAIFFCNLRKGRLELVAGVVSGWSPEQRSYGASAIST